MNKTIYAYQLYIDPATERNLLSLMQRHLKLTLEHGNCQTDVSRRAEIGMKEALVGGF